MTGRNQKRSRREWIALAEAAENSEIASPAPRQSNGRSWTAVLVSLGPKIYAQRIMQRAARRYGARLVRLRRTAQVMNPATGEHNHFYAATFERLDA